MDLTSILTLMRDLEFTSKSFRHCLVAIMTGNKWNGGAFVFHSVLVHIAHNALILLQMIIHIIFTPAWSQKPFFLKRRSCIQDGRREEDVPAPFLLSHSVHTLSSPCLCSSRLKPPPRFQFKNTSSYYNVEEICWICGSWCVQMYGSACLSLQYCVWTDGLNALLGKEMTSDYTKSDMDTLLSMEMKLRLLDLENIQIPEAPPPIPKEPSNYDFVYDCN